MDHGITFRPTSIEHQDVQLYFAITIVVVSSYVDHIGLSIQAFVCLTQVYDSICGAFSIVSYFQSRTNFVISKGVACG